MLINTFVVPSPRSSQIFAGRLREQKPETRNTIQSRINHELNTNYERYVRINWNKLQ